MKKSYQKPRFNLEHFGLSQSIAAACTGGHWDEQYGGPNHWTKDTCGWKDAFGTIRWTEAPKCEEISSISVAYSGVCYNEPSGEFVIFGS